MKAFPHSGICGRCGRERHDLFWHADDKRFYCCDVFRCEARFTILAERWCRENPLLASVGETE